MNSGGGHIGRRGFSVALIIVCSACSCFFDADLPLVNNPPSITGTSKINAQLFYPDSTLCTLTVADRNDSLFSLSAIPCTSMTDETGECFPQRETSWPGGFTMLSGGYGDKRCVLYWSSNEMGVYRGMLFFTDAEGAADTVPYVVSRKFIDTFDDFNLEPESWRLYVPGDSVHCGFDYVDGKLVFMFKKDAAAPEGRQSTGMCSRFSLQGNFYASIDFKLRDEMDEAFEVSFFVSTSSDTGRWSGEKAGIFITGVNGRLRFECRSVDLQSYSFETATTTGELGISRNDSTVSYFFHDGNPAVVPQRLAFQSFPGDTTVFVHLKMSVADSRRDRNCYWNDFTVAEGMISFPAESSEK